MKDRLLAPAAMATVFCLTTTASTAQTEGTMTAEKGWSSVARCAQEDTERHDPVVHQLPGTEQYPWVARLREPAYRSARHAAAPQGTQDG